MKLMFCLKCHDVLKILEEEEECVCGKCTCWYTVNKDNNNKKFFITGPSIGVGYTNKSLRSGVVKYLSTGASTSLEAFVFPRMSSIVIHVNKRRGKDVPAECQKV